MIKKITMLLLTFAVGLQSNTKVELTQKLDSYLKSNKSDIKIIESFINQHKNKINSLTDGQNALTVVLSHTDNEINSAHSKNDIFEIVKLLLENGADINFSYNGKPFIFEILPVISEYKYLEYMDLFISHNLDVNSFYIDKEVKDTKAQAIDSANNAIQKFNTEAIKQFPGLKKFNLHLFNIKDEIKISALKEMDKSYLLNEVIKNAYPNYAKEGKISFYLTFNSKPKSFKVETDDVLFNVVKLLKDNGAKVNFETFADVAKKSSDKFFSKINSIIKATKTK